MQIIYVQSAFNWVGLGDLALFMRDNTSGFISTAIYFTQLYVYIHPIWFQRLHFVVLIRVMMSADYMI